MLCAISGKACQEPVVSVKSGHVFEKSLLLKELSLNGGRCPITKNELSEDDLVELQVPKSVGEQSAASLPQMLAAFQDQWDAVMLEAHTLKQQVKSMRQQLSLALYQRDAAARVIARLMKERDDARRELSEAQLPQQAGAMEDDSAVTVKGISIDKATVTGLSTSLTAGIAAAFKAFKAQRKALKKGKLPAGFAGQEALQKLRAAAVVVEQAASRLVTPADTETVAKHMFVAVGSAVQSVEIASQSVVDSFSVDSEVSTVAASRDGAFVGVGNGNTLSVLRASNGKLSPYTSFSFAAGEQVVAVSNLPVSSLMLVACASGHWALLDVSSRAVCFKGVLPSMDELKEITDACAHVDGQLLLFASSSGKLGVLDLMSDHSELRAILDASEGLEAAAAAVVRPCQRVVSSFSGRHVAVLHANQQVNLWNLETLQVQQRFEQASAVCFDDCGLLMAVATTGDCIDFYSLPQKKSQQVSQLVSHDGAVDGAASELAFAPLSTAFFAVNKGEVHQFAVGA